MGADHDHDHDRGHSHGDHRHGAELASHAVNRLWVALGLTATFMVAEVVAGLFSGSLALLSDAGHMLTDAGALGLAIWAQWLGKRARTGRKTFGYRRAEILAAAANGVVLGVTAVVVIIEAIRRFAAPVDIHGGTMLAVAGVGLVVNLVSAWVLARGARSNVNLRAAAAHVLADAAGSVAAIIAGVLVITRGWTIADPLISILISGLILVGSWRLLREAIHVLMEGVPPSIDVAAVERLVLETPGVSEAHDLHVWSIADDLPVITVHVVLQPGLHGVEVARDVGRRIEHAMGKAHITVQPESTPVEHLLVASESLVRPRK
jgi:cobalt-zinc-cadmium efflux system protein